MKIIYQLGCVLLLICTSACQPTAFTNLSPAEYSQAKEKNTGVLVDVRTPQEFETGHLESASNVDWKSGQFAQEIKNWDKNKTYYLYCASGNRSGQAMQKMKEAGFKKVYNLGGYKDLKAAGLPVK